MNNVEQAGAHNAKAGAVTAWSVMRALLFMVLGASLAVSVMLWRELNGMSLSNAKTANAQTVSSPTETKTAQSPDVVSLKPEAETNVEIGVFEPLKGHLAAVRQPVEITGVPAIQMQPITASDGTAPAEGQGVNWGMENLGYVPKANPGDVIPSLDAPLSNADEWEEKSFEGGVDVVLPGQIMNTTGEIAITDDGRVIVGGKEIMIGGLRIFDKTGECRDASSVLYDCQKLAISEIRKHIEGGKGSCVSMSITTPELMSCSTSSNGELMDLGTWIVSSGYGVTEDVPNESPYHDAEEEARINKRGVWAGSFTFAGKRS